MLRREFVKLCGAAIPLGLAGKVLGEEPIQVKIDPLQQYRQLWEDIIYSIDLKMEYKSSAPDFCLRFSSECSWGIGKKFVMHVFRILRDNQDKTYFDFFSRVEKTPEEISRIWYDLPIDGEILSDHDYDRFKKFAIKLATINYEGLQEVKLCKWNGKFEAKLNEVSLQDPVTQEALWRSEHLEEARKELWERQRLQSIENEKIWNNGK